MFLEAPERSDHPVDVGTRSEGAILSVLVRRGHYVLVPFGFNNRYDFVIDLGGRFIRVQCKTGRLRNGVIVFPTLSTRSSRTGTFRRDYAGDIDVFMVFCPQNEKIYVVPIDDVSRGFCSLRVDPPANGQQKGIRWARDYELPG